LSSAFAGWFPCHSALEVIVALRDCQTSLSRCLHTKNQSQQEESFNRGSMRKANPRFKLTSLCATRTIAGSENKRECGVLRVDLSFVFVPQSDPNHHPMHMKHPLPSVVAIPSRRMRRKRATIIVGSGQQSLVASLSALLKLELCFDCSFLHRLVHSSHNVTASSSDCARHGEIVLAEK
jgi:hypothetical protein